MILFVSPQAFGIDERYRVRAPRPAGFEPYIKRRYNNAIASMERTKLVAPANLLGYIRNQGDYTYRMGDGWRLDLPYIMNANIDMYVCIPGKLFIRSAIDEDKQRDTDATHKDLSWNPGYNISGSKCVSLRSRIRLLQGITIAVTEAGQIAALPIAAQAFRLLSYSRHGREKAIP